MEHDPRMNINKIKNEYDILFNHKLEEYKIMAFFAQIMQRYELSTAQQTALEKALAHAQQQQQLPCTPNTPLPDTINMNAVAQATTAVLFCRYGCNDFFVDRTGRLKHEKNNHPEKFPYHCQHCKWPYNNLHYLLIHEATCRPPQQQDIVLATLPKS
jgi:hypothetical protein